MVLPSILRVPLFVHVDRHVRGLLLIINDPDRLNFAVRPASAKTVKFNTPRIFIWLRYVITHSRGIINRNISTGRCYSWFIPRYYMCRWSHLMLVFVTRSYCTEQKETWSRQHKNTYVATMIWGWVIEWIGNAEEKAPMWQRSTSGSLHHWSKKEEQDTAPSKKQLYYSHWHFTKHTIAPFWLS